MWLKRISLALLAVLLVVALILTVTAQGRTAVRTALFIPQVIPTIPVKPQEWFTGDPAVEEVSYPTADGTGVADLYTPAGGGAHGGVLLFLGVNPAGRDDPRVVGLAEGLARSGAIVMIPWSDTMTEKRVWPGDVDSLVRAFAHLLSHERVDPERSGMGGFCVGASFAAVAAQDERIGDKRSVRELLRRILRRARPGGVGRVGQPLLRRCRPNPGRRTG